jgi:hypothetical protein
MIDCAIMFYQGRIVVQSNTIIEEKNLNLIKSALTELNRRAVSKVVQLEKLRLGISSFKYKSSILAFAVFGKNIAPKLLLDCSADLAESFVQNFAKLNIEDSGVKNSISKEFENITMEYNKRISKSKKQISEIDKNLKEGIDISKQSIENLMKKGEILIDIDNRSVNLSKQAIDFENSGRNLKNDVMRQRMKFYLICAILTFLTIFIFFRRL